MSLLPDVPTVAESGVPGYEPAYWYGVFVPAATPKDIVGKLADAVGESLQSPDVVANLANQGASSASMRPQEFAQYVKAEAAKWGKVVRDAGAKLD